MKGIFQNNSFHYSIFYIYIYKKKNLISLQWHSLTVPFNVSSFRFFFFLFNNIMDAMILMLNFTTYCFLRLWVIDKKLWTYCLWKIIIYSQSTINAYSLLSHEWWVPLIKFMVGPIIHVREGTTYLWYSGST